MKRFCIIILIGLLSCSIYAERYNYKFIHTPVSEALKKISKENPDIDIFFIYKELNHYYVSKEIRTDNIKDVINNIIENHPISLINKDNKFFVEALQKGNFVYSGQVLDREDEPLVGTTIYFLNPKDSVVITFGVADIYGFFSIPCDTRDIIAKLSCMGYENLLIPKPDFKMGKLFLNPKPTVLNSITVEQDYSIISADKNIYLPTLQQKRAAQNATDLLLMMAIPQIDVDPRTGSVESNNGNTIGVYIDYVKASEEEKNALNPQDVSKIEYLVFPSDPRFSPDRYVVNIILKNQQIGGYVKATGTGVLIADVLQGQFYSKMAYKRMIYDLSVTNRYVDRGHTGTQTIQKFLFPEDNQYEEIIRSNIMKDSRMQMNNLSASFRAVFSHENINISNKVSLVSNYNPHTDNHGIVIIENSTKNISQFSPYSNAQDARRISPQWEGNYFFEFGKSYKLSVQPYFYFHSLLSNRLYKTDKICLVTNAKDHYFQGQLQAALSKDLNRKNTLSLYFVGIYINDKVKYSGNINSNPIFLQQGYSILPSYNLTNGKFNLQAYGGILIESNRIDNVISHSLLPLAQLSLQYSINPKNTIAFSGKYNVKDVDLSNKTPDIIQENEFLYKTGNPDLRNVQWAKLDMEYNGIFNNKLSYSGYFGWNRYFKYVTPIYNPYASYSILRTLINGGDYQNWYIGCTATLKLFNNSLVLNARAKMNFEKLTGQYPIRNNYLFLGLFATYYIKNFYFNGFYYPAYTEIPYGSLIATTAKGNSFYSIGMGWSNKLWNISITALNPFRNKWPDQISYLDSKWFDQKTTTLNTDTHQTFRLTVSYIFQFGKKIKQKDELYEVESTGSAIMLE